MRPRSAARMVRRWLAVVATGTTWLGLATGAAADHVPVKNAIVYVHLADEVTPIHSTAFFLGERGYLLTVLANPKVPVGRTLDITYMKDGAPIAQKAAIVDINEKSGIALLRLTNAKYPFEHAALTIADIGDPFGIDPEQSLRIYHSLPKSPHLDSTDCKLLNATPDDGRLTIKGLEGEKFIASMMGAPVFSGKALIGLLGNNTTIHPINHAAPFVAMAESTIIGKDMIRQLVDGMAKSKSFLSEQDLATWGRFLDAVEYVRLLTPVEADIEEVSDPQASLGKIFQARVRIRPLVGIMKDPELIEVTAYPQFTYQAPGDKAPTLVPWAESQARAPQQKDIFFYHKFEKPTRQGELTKEINFGSLKQAISNAWKLTPEQSNRLRIDGFLLEWSWEVAGDSGRKLPQRNRDYKAVKER